MLVLLGALAALAATACVEVGPNLARRPPIPPRNENIVVGAFNFSESRLLAEIYRQALDAGGFDAEVIERVVSREIMEPALEQGEVDLVAEYLGTALTFVDPKGAAESSAAGVAHAALETELVGRGLLALPPAPGQNRNEIVVTLATANEYNLNTISELSEVAGELVFGGPPECPARPLCLLGLEETYGLTFESFVPLDPGLHTVAALDAGDIDVALLFTTNPQIETSNLVILTDDRHLQPAENIVPVLRREVADRYGPGLVETLNAVTARLTDTTLRELNHRAEIDLVPVGDIATEWLESEGLL
jgi:osmoprotectant transport system substrate-binding protein